jgi:GT2 family glycosyltransferase
MSFLDHISRFIGRPDSDEEHWDAQTSKIRRAVLRSGLFEEQWYVSSYPDVVHHSQGPLHHFVSFGLMEGRIPGPRVPGSLYRERLEKGEGHDSWSRLYILNEIAEAEAAPAPSPAEAVPLPTDTASLGSLVVEGGLFDHAWYVARYPDIRRAGVDPLAHFVYFGADELRNPGPLFDSKWYADTYKEYALTGFSPIEHYLRIGRAKGARPNGGTPHERQLALVREIRRGSAAPASGPDRLLVHPLPGVGKSGAGKPLPERVKESQPAAVLIVVGDTVLEEGAEERFGIALAEEGACFAYADHDRVTDEGQYVHPRFKPEYSPEYLRHQPYVGPVLGIAADMLARMDLAAFAARVEAEGVRGLAAELLAYAGDGREHRVLRIPEVLSHVRGEDASTRTHPAGRPDVEGGWPKVSVLIPTRDMAEVTRACIESIESRSTYPRDRIEIVLIDNGSKDEAALEYFEELSRQANRRVVRAPGRFNFALLNNAGVRESTGEVLVFLNNDTMVIEPDWLEELVAYATQEDIGAVGCKLLYPDGTIQHGGTVLGVQGVGAHCRVGQPNELAVDDCTREMSTVTGACLAIRRELFDALGGFDPVLAVAFNDVKLCIEAMRAGHRNIYVGRALLHHHESKSRGYDDSPEKAARTRREATYVRRQYPELFQDDPYYSPNLSLQDVGEVALPPRGLGPPRARPPGQKGHVLLLSWTHRMAQGVPCVLREQALRFREEGWRVSVGGPVADREFDYPQCERIELATPEAAAMHAVRNGVDAIVAHTPPFYSVVRWLGRCPLVYVMDHGEPPPEFFADREGRVGANAEKWFCAALAKRVFAISEAVRNQGFEPRTRVIRNGNTHLSRWTDESPGVRRRARERLGLKGKLVVLNVCRFEEQDRLYKGVDHYAEVAQAMPYLCPPLAGRVEFVLAGRGSSRDAQAMERAGLRVFANLSDTELTDLYAAADAYMNFSRWEGYNLGIGQALAMGLPVIASDIEAHREFPISVTNDVAVAVQMLGDIAKAARKREAICFEWTGPTREFEELIAADVAAHGSAGPCRPKRHRS